MKKSLFRRVVNRVLNILVRFAPGAQTVRPFLHRLRGVKIGPGAFIGDEVYIDNEYPECIEIQENAQISIRAIIIAHTRGSGKVIIGKSAFIGPNSTIVCGAGRTLKIGEGAVIAAGSVVMRSIPPRMYMAPAGPKPLARVGKPLPEVKSLEEFWAGLTPLPTENENDSGKT